MVTLPWRKWLKKAGSGVTSASPPSRFSRSTASPMGRFSDGRPQSVLCDSWRERRFSMEALTGIGTICVRELKEARLSPWYGSAKRLSIDP